MAQENAKAVAWHGLRVLYMTRWISRYVYQVLVDVRISLGYVAELYLECHHFSIKKQVAAAKLSAQRHVVPSVREGK